MSLEDDQAITTLRAMLVAANYSDAAVCLEPLSVKRLKFQGTLDTYTVHLLSHCDGRRPLRDLIAELAQAMDLPLGELTSATVDVFRNLLGLGFLKRARTDEGGMYPPIHTEED